MGARTIHCARGRSDPALVRLRGVLFAALVLTACAPLRTAPEPLPNDASELWVSNQTTLTVTLAVNGSIVRSFAPGEQGAVAPRDLPPQPWSAQTRSPSGRVLSSLTVRPGDVWRTDTPGGGHAYQGDAVRIDLSCGRLDLWSGPPLLGPPPGPGTPGDCAP